MAEERTITLAHGGGGRQSRELVVEHFLNLGKKTDPRDLDDAAVLEAPAGRLAFTTDSFVVTPRFFPGGNIGKLAVFGTVNDLAAMGARPVALSVGLVIEEGLAASEVARVAEAVAQACAEAGVAVVTGDTKVVERGAADGLFINTSGIGAVHPKARLSGRNARPGDVVIVSGPVGDHGIAIMAARNELAGLSGLSSDSAPLTELAFALLDAAGEAVHVLRDPTRGGLAAALNEIALQAEVAIALDEDAIPVSEATRGACELLGLDPLYLACEGRLVACVAQRAAERALEALRALALGAQARAIGEVLEGPAGLVSLRTALGVERVLDMPSGEHLPRIC